MHRRKRVGITAFSRKIIFYLLSDKEEAQKLTMQEFLEEERIRGSEGTQSSLTQSKVETSRAADDGESPLIHDT